MSAPTPSVLMLVDAAGMTRNASVAEALGADMSSIADLGRTACAGRSWIAVDVDLGSLDNVRRLRMALPKRRHGDYRAFAVDRRRRIEVVHANILGATALLHRPATEAELVASMREHALLGSDGPTTGSAQASLGQAADAMRTAFLALSTGAELSLDTLDSASTAVSGAIAQSGFGNWMELIREHHEGTFQHCLLVTSVATQFGRATGMSARDTSRLTMAALLHDIGKAAIATSILDKPDALTRSERLEMERHPVLGHAYLQTTAGIDADTLAAVRGHHEYLDGSGYPDGLAGAGIGDLTRIMTVCDIYGAMTEKRAYKPPVSPGDAIEVLVEMAAAGKLELALVRALESAVQG